MGFFAAEQARRVRDLGQGRAGWLVELPDLSYTGRVIAPATADAAWVVEQLEVVATRLGYAVACGRMTSPLNLDRWPPFLLVYACRCMH